MVAYFPCLRGQTSCQPTQTFDHFPKRVEDDVAQPLRTTCQRNCRSGCLATYPKVRGQEVSHLFDFPESMHGEEMMGIDNESVCASIIPPWAMGYLSIIRCKGWRFLYSEIRKDYLRLKLHGSLSKWERWYRLFSLSNVRDPSSPFRCGSKSNSQHKVPPRSKNSTVPCTILLAQYPKLASKPICL